MEDAFGNLYGRAEPEGPEQTPSIAICLGTSNGQDRGSARGTGGA